MKVVIIGGGPAGMMAGISSANSGDDVCILEKNEKLGRKLLITGKGRCNITSSLEMKDFIANVPGNGRFLYSCFENFTNQDIIAMLKKQGVAVKEERGNRIFPVSDKSMDVLRAFEKELNANVTEIEIKENKVTGVEYIDEFGKKKKIIADKVILATGGNSYKSTGSNGEGYEIARKLGHTIKTIRPSLVPLTSRGESLRTCSELQGLSLKNTAIKIVDCEKNKTIYEDFGEMLFTHFGISGPTILSGSAHLLRYKNVDELLKNGRIKLCIDFKPALSQEKLDLRIQRDFEKGKNKEFKNSLNELLPQKLIPVIVRISGIAENKKVNEITREERRKLVELLKKFEIEIVGFRPIDEAIVTSGGINIKEINPKTMESKIIDGLYFAGEIIDVDAYTGGFNLQIAYSTGYTAGMHIE